jgi:ubiquinone/menaquinone biosynthesis C-methylase UbiE
MVVEKLPTIKWDPIVDDKPDTASPRIKFSQEFARENQRESNGNVLDLGCGIGSYTYIVDRQGCVGIDLDINALKIAKKYCKYSEFIVSSAFNLPFRDETFDIVYMWEVLEYLKPGSEAKLIQEVHKISTSKAQLFLSAPNNHFLHNIFDPDYILRRQRHFRLSELITLISSRGFSIKRFYVRGSWNTIIATNIFYFFKHAFHKKNVGILRYFEKKSEKELNSKNNGATNIFISAEKRMPAS